MAVNRADRYPGRWGTETTDYPLGVPKNRTSAASQDGSYFEKDWISDYEAFFGALMTKAGLTADGTSDTATDSQFYDALEYFISFLSIGVDQTWQDITASRSGGVTYTNTTGRPIFVSLSVNPNINSWQFIVDSIVVAEAENNPDSSVTRNNISAVIPDGSEYSITSGAIILAWAELR